MVLGEYRERIAVLVEYGPEDHQATEDRKQCSNWTFVLFICLDIQVNEEADHRDAAENERIVGVCSQQVAGDQIAQDAEYEHRDDRAHEDLAGAHVAWLERLDHVSFLYVLVT